MITKVSSRVGDTGIGIFPEFEKLHLLFRTSVIPLIFTLATSFYPYKTTPPPLSTHFLETISD